MRLCNMQIYTKSKNKPDVCELPINFKEVEETEPVAFWTDER